MRAPLHHLVLLLAAGAPGNSPRPAAPATPEVISADGRTVPDNVLSARVVFSTRLGDSVHVAYWSGDRPVQATPYRLARGAVDTIVVLGLRPSTTYGFRVEGERDGVVRASSNSSFTSRRLPAVLTAVRMERLAGGLPTRLALTVVPAGHGWYGVAFDSSGAIVWYHDFTRYGRTVTNLIKQPNGHYTAYVGDSFGWQPTEGYFVELTAGGRKVAEYHPPAGHYMDPHELLLTGDGPSKRAHFFTYTLRTLDLTSVGGKDSVQTAGHQIVRMTPSGDVDFMWDAWDHIGIDEWTGDADEKRRTLTDFDHPNALTFDAHGNYVVSWRNLSQVMAIAPDDGAILWRVGGAKSDYAFVGDPLGGFSKQHAVKILANGHLLLFDNGTEHSPSESRGVEYELDHAKKTARMVWQYRHQTPLFAPFVGWVQRLKNGDTWVAFSLLDRVVEVDQNSRVVWEGRVHTSAGKFQTYRITPIASLR